jgi:type I restriction enzyme S subunit
MDDLAFQNIDKSDWKAYRFEEIAFSISERVEPTETNLEIYVGLEHLDSGSIHIRRFGKRSDVNGTKLKVYPGDIIFGRRRAYQRKASIANFEGFCSAHSLVLRANPEVIYPNLFPFFLHSDTFMKRAVDISVGSLSPTINWGTLKKEKFLLPPIDQQINFAQMLWDLDDLIEKYYSLFNRLSQLFDISSSELIWKQQYELKPIIQCVNKKLGKFIDGDWIESKDQSDGGIRLLQLADIGIREFLDKSNRFISDDTFYRLNCFEVLPGDVLIARMPDPIGRACVVPEIGMKMITAVDCCIVRVDNENYINRYIMYLFNTKEMLSKIIRQSGGTTRQRISRTKIEKIQVPLPSYEIQKDIIIKLDSILNNINILKNVEQSIKKVEICIINQIS